MNTEALERLATLLDTVPDEKFDLQVWRGRGGPGWGTVACAVGHACADPWFNEQGLTMTAGGSPEFGDYIWWEAVQEFFDLSIDDANRLFNALSYRAAPNHRIAVIARIRQFLIHHSTD